MIRWNLTASGPRSNPQGPYHYGNITISRTIKLANLAPMINRKHRYDVNSVSFNPPNSPFKLADHFKIQGVFSLGSIPENPTGGGGYLQTAVMAANFRAFINTILIFNNIVVVDMSTKVYLRKTSVGMNARFK